MQNLSLEAANEAAPGRWSLAQISDRVIVVVVALAGAGLVLGILLILGIVIPRYSDNLEKGKQESARTQIATLKSTLQLFQMDQGFFPESLDGLITNPGDSRIENYPPGGYLDTSEIPKDPWCNAYVYVVPGAEGREYDLESYGRDGLDGGEGFDADIESWDL